MNSHLTFEAMSPEGGCFPLEGGPAVWFMPADQKVVAPRLLT